MTKKKSPKKKSRTKRKRKTEVPISVAHQPRRRRFSVPGLGPFGLALALERAPLRARLPADRRAELRGCWTPLQVAALSTDRIVELLGQLGVRVTKERFREQADGRTSAWCIADESWISEYWDPRRAARFESLMGLAAVELWRRWLPGWPCAELLAEQIEEGYRLLTLGARRAAREAWMGVWQLLEVRAADTLDLETTELVDTPRDLAAWHEELAAELAVEAFEDPSAVELCLSFLGRSIELFSRGGGPRPSELRARLAEVLLLVGRRAEAEQELEALVQEAAGPFGSGGEAQVRYAQALLFGLPQPTKADLTLARELLESAESRRLGFEPLSRPEHHLPWVARRLAGEVPLGDGGDPATLVRRLLEAGVWLPSVLRCRIAAAGDAAVPHLLELLEDPALAGTKHTGEGWGPVHAAELLGRLAGEGAIEPLLRAMRHASEINDEYLSEGCARGLQQVGAAALEPLLALHRGGVSRELGIAVRQALSLLGVHDDRVLALLVGGLEEGMYAATSFLSCYGDERAVGPLEARLSWEERYVELDDDDLAYDFVYDDRDVDEVRCFALSNAIEALGGREWRSYRRPSSCLEAAAEYRAAACQ